MAAASARTGYPYLPLIPAEKGRRFPVDPEIGYGHQRLDQPVTELLLGVR